MKAIVAATVLMMTDVSASRVIEVKLILGDVIPSGWADGLKHSIGSMTECHRILKAIPDNAPSKPMTKFIVKIDYTTQ